MKEAFNELFVLTLVLPPVVVVGMIAAVLFGPHGKRDAGTSSSAPSRAA
jgi:ABC-type molybdate transport system permease subunit